MSRSEAVTAYVDRAAPFARPILTHLRGLVHRALPEVEEAMKWSMPFFVHRGRPLANMAAFKAHASFGFWRREGAGPDAEPTEGMGQFGKLTSLADLPPDTELIAMIRAAAAVIDAGGATVRRPAKAPKADIAMPDDLAAALAAAPTAATGFAALPPGARRDYLEWVTTAKQAATRQRRVEATVAQCAEGKKLHWKYEGC